MAWAKGRMEPAMANAARSANGEVIKGVPGIQDVRAVPRAMAMTQVLA